MCKVNRAPSSWHRIDRVRDIAAGLLGVMMILLGAVSVHAWHHRDLSPYAHECRTESPRDCTQEAESCVSCDFILPLLAFVTVSLVWLPLSLGVVHLLGSLCTRLIVRRVDRYSLSDPPREGERLMLEMVWRHDDRLVCVS